MKKLLYIIIGVTLLAACSEQKKYVDALNRAKTITIESGQKEKAKRYMDIYEVQSGYFDNNGNIEKGREIYYYSKGQYFLASQQYDSAEYYFKKDEQLITNKEKEVNRLNSEISLYKEKLYSFSVWV